MVRGRVKTHLTVNLVSFRGKKKRKKNNKQKKNTTPSQNDVQSQNSTDCCNVNHSPIPPEEYKIHNANDIATLTSF